MFWAKKEEVERNIVVFGEIKSGIEAPSRIRFYSLLGLFFDEADVIAGCTPEGVKTKVSTIIKS